MIHTGNDHKGYYNTLGVSSDASDKEIRKSYLRLAKKYHPDRNSGCKSAREQFEKVQEAYEVLGDNDKRKAYDAGYDEAQFPGGAQGFDFGGHGSGFGFGDIFEQVFGSGFGSWRSQPSKPKDLSLVLENALTLEDVYNGVTVSVSFMRIGKCTRCDGRGSASTAKCGSCNGRGYIARGFMTMYCNACQGSGQEPCNGCGGNGQVREKHTTSLKVPAGTEHNAQIRVRGEGNFEHGIFGDVVAQIKVKPHQIFEYVGNGNLKIVVTAPFTLALTGGDVTVPCIDKTSQTVRVPRGAQQGYETTVRGKGIGSGMLIVRINFEFPRDLTTEQRQALDALGLTNADYSTYTQEQQRFSAYLG